jgi:transposase
MTHAVHSHTQIEHHGTRDSEHNLRSGKGQRRKLSKREVESLLAMYRQGEKTIAEIAGCYAVHPSFVTYVAKRAGLPLRGRGRRPRVEPSPAVQEILLEAWITTYAEAAARFEMSKQRVGQLVKRWEAWTVAQLGPRKIKPDEINEEQEQRPVDPVRPHVISFRVTDSELVKLLAQGGNRSEPWTRSQHSVARFLLFRCLGSNPGGDYEHRETLGSAP